MPANPNTNFTTGATLSSNQMNRLPRGVMNSAVSSTNYTLTTTETIATGMSLSFTAEANRLYRISYYEPQAQTATVLSNTQLTIRRNNATGTVIQNTVFANETAAMDQGGMYLTVLTTFAAGSVTIVGTAKVSVTTGAPALIRDSTRFANLIVEDLGPS
ncbi:hypothetical protein UFOVP363_11 [uncultured Caudovirales phage]|uniref:Uncharacterized protein n=1 Tax=uncultured Caudovirales phage TaxID=2100421 RepID=A0A6J7WZ35_9CAUD|nr:hypothetical protein UFOVP363_11 [uncultured Caudovirales phage]